MFRCGLTTTPASESHVCIWFAWCRSQTPIADCFDLLAHHVKALLHSPVQGYVFCSDEIATMVLRKVDQFQQLYATYAQVSSAKQPPNVSANSTGEGMFLAGPAPTMRARDVLLLCRDFNLYDKFTHPASVVRVITSLCPDMQRDNTVDSRVELSVLDLIECLVGCALVRDPAPAAELREADAEPGGDNADLGAAPDDVTDDVTAAGCKDAAQAGGRDSEDLFADTNTSDTGHPPGAARRPPQQPRMRTPSITLTEAADDIASMDAVGLPHDRAGQVVRVATLLGLLFNS